MYGKHMAARLQQAAASPRAVNELNAPNLIYQPLTSMQLAASMSAGRQPRGLTGSPAGPRTKLEVSAITGFSTAKQTAAYKVSPGQLQGQGDLPRLSPAAAAPERHLQGVPT